MKCPVYKKTKKIDSGDVYFSKSKYLLSFEIDLKKPSLKNPTKWQFMKAGLDKEDNSPEKDIRC